jgi:hypothetical protein
MKKSIDIVSKALVPVHGTHGCAGHLLRSARGFRAIDVQDREVGTYASSEAGIAALSSGLGSLRARAPFAIQTA